MLAPIVSILITAAPNPISFVPVTPTNTQSANYRGNKAPLSTNPLIKLPVGSVKAGGWVREYLVRQKNGMTGQLPQISEWLRKEGNAWMNPEGKGKGGWEEVPYWLKGYISLAYQLQDKAMIAESNSWIEAALRSQRPNGDFGPDQKFEDGTRDFWGNMLMLSCLRTYYEATQDKRVIDLMSKYFAYQNTIPAEKFLTGYWQKARGADNLASIYWLYNITGDPILLELAAKNHDRTMNWSMPESLPDWHNVNVAESFDEPGIYSQQSKNKANLRAAYENFVTMRRLYGQVPGGMYGADENARKGFGDPRQAIETCGMVEQMLSDEELLEVSGDTMWADHCENVAFNTYPAATLPDFRALRYLTSPNMVTADGFNHAPGFQNYGPMSLFNPLSHRCCQHNHSMGWPYYAEHMWMATNDNGIAATLYGENSVTAKVGKGQKVTITEKTHYPFEEQVSFTVNVSGKSNKFPLYLRLPEWCNKAKINVGGASKTAPKGSGYVRIDRNWQNGDVVVLTLPMDISASVWTGNKNAMSVNYGPLTFSLKIPEIITKEDPTKSTEGDSQWQKNADFSKWQAYQYMPGAAWNYALAFSPSQIKNSVRVVKKAWPKNNFPFTLADVPISIQTKGSILPEWGVDRTGLVAVLQQSPTVTKTKVQTIELVPMGAARLRISAFPWTAPNGQAWKPTPKPLPYQASASHTFGGDTIDALLDNVMPSSSADETVPRFTWWDHKGSSEWVQYMFPKAMTVQEVSVYWFDDTGKGMCRVPKYWRILARVNGQWQPISTTQEHGVVKDTMNTVKFNPVQATGLRIEAQLQEGFSGGILEWRVK